MLWNFSLKLLKMHQGRERRKMGNCGILRAAQEYPSGGPVAHCPLPFSQPCLRVSVKLKCPNVTLLEADTGTKAKLRTEKEQNWAIQSMNVSHFLWPKQCLTPVLCYYEQKEHKLVPFQQIKITTNIKLSICSHLCCVAYTGAREQDECSIIFQHNWRQLMEIEDLIQQTKEKVADSDFLCGS